MALLGINTNVSGSVYRTQSNMDLTARLLNESLKRIETGNRINSAGDDPIGFLDALTLKNDQQEAELQQADNVEHMRELDDMDSRLTGILDALSEIKDLKTQQGSATGSALAAINAQMDDLGQQIDELQTGADLGFGANTIQWGTEASQTAGYGAITIASLSNTSATTDIDGAICNAMVGAGQVGVIRQNVMASAQSLLTSRIEGFANEISSIMKVDEAEESAKVTALQSRQQALVASLQVQNAFAASTVNFLA